MGLQDVFRYPTIRLQAKRIGELQKGYALEENVQDQPVTEKREMKQDEVRETGSHDGQAVTGRYTKIPPAPPQPMYPASYAQRRLFVVQQDEHTGTSYNMPLAFKLRGKLDLKRLEKAFLTLLERHEALRTSFHHDGNDVWMRIHPLSELKWRLEVQEEESANNMARADDIQRWIASCIRPFALDTAPLLRAFVRKLSPEEHLLLIDTHHIVSDGMSTNVLLNELFKIYDGETLPPLEVQYKDYAVWERNAQDNEEYAKAKAYWNELFAGEVPVAEWPTDFVRPQIRRYEGAQCTHTIRLSLYEKIKRAAAEHEVTPYMVLMAAYHILLSKYSGYEDIVTGAPIAGRDHADLANIIGMFVKTLPLRTEPVAELTVREYLAHVRKRVLDGQAHAVYPLEALLDDLDLPLDSGRSPLFDNVFVLQNMERAQPRIAGLEIEPCEVVTNRSKFDLTWACAEETDGLRIAVEYDTALFRAGTVARMLRHFERILEQIADEPERRIAEVELLTAKEKALLDSFAGTVADYPRQLTIYERFLQQVERVPDETALVFRDERVSYRELERRARLLSRELCRRGVQRGDAVGLLAERSVGMIIAIFAILRTGAAYVPLDPTHPRERLSYMLKDSGARLLLAEPGLDRPAFAGEVMLLDERLWNGGLERTVPEMEAVHETVAALEVAEAEPEPGASLASAHKGRPDALAEARPQVDPNDTAYIMYTSGSTGTPKGVVTTHRNVIKTSVNNGFADIGPGDRMLQLSNYAFDGSTYEIFGALLNGATLVLIRREDVLNAAALCRVLREERITSAFMTAALFNTVVDWDVHSLQHVRKLFFGGEAASKKHVLKALDALGPGRIANGYGPTETTVFAATYTVDESVREWNTVPIGRPIHNTKLYVLNRWGQRQPVGVAGELYIGGEGLAKGYLNRPDLTQKAFIESTFEFAPGERLYRTGDLVRWLPDGNLEYLGRLDRQVKIRGHRIEPDEVEARLIALPEVSEAVVEAGRDEQGHSFLIAYVVPEKSEVNARDETKLEDVLRRQLRSRLPEYMVPTVFVFLERMPLNANGKIDRRSLPAPKPQHAKRYVAAKDEIERKLAGIWEEVLGIERIGMTDSFFELGGHSLKAMKLLARIEQAFQVRLSLREVYAFPTIRELAVRIGSTSGIVPQAVMAHHGQRNCYRRQQYR